MKKIVIIIPTALVTDSLLLFIFCTFIETKNKNQISSKLVVWFCFYWVTLYLKSMLNPINVLKEILSE